MPLFPRALPLLVLIALTGAAQADLVPPNGGRILLDIVVIDDRPFVQASLNGVAGLAMVDTGTPFGFLANRDAVPLDQGAPLATGTAASGQAVVIRRHAGPPALTLGEVSVGLPPPLHSADLGFVAQGLGIALVGFVGAPMLDRGAFGLDFAARRMVVAGTGPEGRLPDPPDPADVLATGGFLLPPGDQPLFAGTVGGPGGGRPILIDMDTGDVTTLYLAAAGQGDWRAAGLLAEGPEGPELRGLAFGGGSFAPLPVRLVTATGPEDHRSAGQPDMLRLGGRFLRHHPMLWNMAGHRYWVLRPGSGWFAD